MGPEADEAGNGIAGSTEDDNEQNNEVARVEMDQKHVKQRQHFSFLNKQRKYED